MELPEYREIFITRLNTFNLFKAHLLFEKIQDKDRKISRYIHRY